MQITNNMGTQPHFGVRIVANSDFRKTVKYAEKHGKLQELDNALYKLSKANKGDLLVINGIDKDGNAYSNFTINAKRTQPNNCKNSPEEAAVKGFIELAEFGHKFEKLFGKKVKFRKLNTYQVFEKYSDKTLG